MPNSANERRILSKKSWKRIGLFGETKFPFWETTPRRACIFSYSLPKSKCAHTKRTLSKQKAIDQSTMQNLQPSLAKEAQDILQGTVANNGNNGNSDAANNQNIYNAPSSNNNSTNQSASQTNNQDEIIQVRPSSNINDNINNNGGEGTANTANVTTLAVAKDGKEPHQCSEQCKHQGCWSWFKQKLGFGKPAAQPENNPATNSAAAPANINNGVLGNTITNGSTIKNNAASTNGYTNYSVNQQRNN